MVESEYVDNEMCHLVRSFVHARQYGKQGFAVPFPSSEWAKK